MVDQESSVANPQKVSKIDEKIRKMEKDGLATLLLPINYPILGIIGEIYQMSRHRCHRLIIGYHG
jgi:hypothetical protein